MGRLSAPYGVHGWLKVQPFTEATDGLLAYERWWIGPQLGWRQFELMGGRVQGPELVVQLKGIEDRDQAAALRGWQVAVPRSDLPPPAQGEYYWSDLIGLTVVNLQGDLLGRVEEVFATGANHVLVVRGERERLIPFVESVLVAVELQQSRVVVDWGVDY